GPDKVAHLHELGFDVALDHRTGNLRQELKEAVPQGIDVYYENVGGDVFNAVLPRLNTFARVPVCGLVANYNLTELPEGPTARVRSWVTSSRSRCWSEASSRPNSPAGSPISSSPI